jgi:hypothetical protein
MTDNVFPHQSQWQATHWTTDGVPDGGQSYGVGFCIAWQRGSLKDNGRNGAFIVEVIEACLDELRFKNGQFPCRENELAIAHLEAALNRLNERLARRHSEGISDQHLESSSTP